MYDGFISYTNCHGLRPLFLKQVLYIIINTFKLRLHEF